MTRLERLRLSFDTVLGTFTFYQTLAILLIGAFAVMTGYILTYRSTVSRLHAIGESSVETAARILSQPLWNYDQSTLDQYGNVFLKSGTICRIQVTGEDGRIVLDLTQHQEPEGASADHFSLTQSIYYQNMKIGSVSLMIPLINAQIRARHTATTMALMTFILLMVILMTSIVQVRRFVLNPLARLVERVREISAGDYSEKLELLPKQEYRSIVDEFNAMGDRIQTREQEIRTASHRYQTLMNTVPDGFFLMDRNGTLVQINDTFVQMYGYTEDELPNLNLADHLSADGFTEPMAREKVFEAWKHNHCSFRWEGKRKDGTTFPAEIKLQRVDLEGHRYLMALVRDISARVKAERALMESEERFRAMADKTTAAIFIYERFVLFANPATEAITGYTLEELRDIPFWELAHPEDQEVVRERGQAQLRGEETGKLNEFRIIHKSGETRWVNFHSQRIEYEGINCALGTAVDITDRVEAQRALQDEKERLRVTLQSIGDAVIATDRNGKVVLMNRIAANLCGWDEKEALDKPLTDVFKIVHEQTRERISSPVDRVIDTGKIVSLANHTVLISKAGVEHVIEDSGAPIRNRAGEIVGVVLVFRDETEKKRVEEELFRSRKLESIGLLAGGIAHDFNNLLTAIIGNLEMAQLKSESPGLTSNLAEAETAAMRAKDLAGQLLTFSRGGAPIKRRTDITSLLRDTTNFVLAGSNVDARFFLSEDLPELEADAGQISQVIQNIVLNADQAMPEGGLIDIAAEVTILTEHPTLPDGEYVRVFFRDYGIGISKKFLPKVFDPYFTTKQKGNGLGLSTAYSIVKRHEGHIEVSSEPGMGTTFTMLLPTGISPETLAAEDSEPAVSRNISVTVRPMSVLIMDDEDSILEILGEMLAFLGHRVTESLDGAEAIRLVKEHVESDTPFDLVILDLTVPGGLGGREALLEIRKIDPDVRAIVSSGYANDPVMADYSAHGFDYYVSKPFKMNELSVAIRAVAEQMEKQPRKG